MRVLVAPDRYAGLLTALEAAEALAAGWRTGAGHDVVEILALSDGGLGFLDTVGAVHAGHTEVIVVSDPWGREVPATVLLVPTRAGLAAYVEAAQVCGPHLRRPGDDLGRATSAGLGRLLAAALDVGATSIVVGLTGAAVPDGGLGVAAGFAGAGGPLAAGPAGLVSLTADDLAPLHAARTRLRGVPVVGLGDLSRPLLGLAGVAATEVADPALGQRIESAVGPAVALIRRELGERTELLTGSRLRWDRIPGAGAGAGLGFGLAVLGASIEDGSTRCLAELGGAHRIATADLVVTGTLVLGVESLHSSPVTAVAAEAAAHGIPVVAIGGRVEAGRRETMAAGFAGTYAVATSLDQWPAFTAQPAALLSARAAAVARTWSP